MTDAHDVAPWVERARAILAKTPDADAYEVRAEVQTDRKAVRRNGAARLSSRTHGSGLGVRVFHRHGSGYAYTNEFSDAALRAAVQGAARLAVAHAHVQGSAPVPRIDAPHQARPKPMQPDHPEHDDGERVQDLLQRAEAGVCALVPQARTQVAFGYKSSETLFADSAGSWVGSRTLHSTLLVQTVLREGARTADGNTWLGGSRGLADYEDGGGPEELGRRAAEQAIEGLGATGIAAGRYRVLTDNHLTGIMAHESFGHLTEYDLVASGWSVLAGRRGERLADAAVTIRDAPVVGDGRDGVAVPFDSEGSPGRSVTLLDRGVLTGFLHARDDAPSADGSPTGNARALAVHHAPIVRMRNTYVEPGDLTMEEAFEALGTGAYLVGGRGGSPRADGSFMFTSQRGYWVEKGRIAHPIKMASIYGNVLDFLQRVEGLTRDLKISTTYFGGCGKWDQSPLPVGMGGPHVLVSEALLGGQGAGSLGGMIG